MIIDRIEHYKKYPFGAAWEKAFEFLTSLTAETIDKKYEIQGDEIYAIVMSYGTKDPTEGLFESHQTYVDIQTVLAGSERFECAFVNDLPVRTPYDAQSDAMFYAREKAGQTRVDVTFGTFVMFYPHDAHLAGVMIDGNTQWVKKVVVKIKKTLVSAT